MTSLDFYNFVKEQISQSQFYEQKKNIDNEDFKFLHFEFKNNDYDNALDLILNSKKSVNLESITNEQQSEQIPFSDQENFFKVKNKNFYSYKTYFFIKWRKEGIYIKSGTSEIKSNKKGQLYLSPKRHLTIIYREKDKRFLFSYKFGRNLITQTFSLKNWDKLLDFLFCSNSFGDKVNKSIVFKMANLQFQSEFIENNISIKPYIISNEYVNGITSLEDFEKNLFGFKTGSNLSFEELIIVFLNIKPNNYKDFFEFYINKKDKIFKNLFLLKKDNYFNLSNNDILKIIKFFFFEKVNQKIFEGKFSTDSELNNLIRKEYLRIADLYLHKVFSKIENKIEIDFQTLEDLENAFLEKLINFHVETLQKPNILKLHKIKKKQKFKFSRKIEKKFLNKCYDLDFVLSKNIHNRVEVCQIYSNNNSERYTVVVEICQKKFAKVVGIFSKKAFDKKTINSILTFIKKNYGLEKIIFEPLNVELTNEQRWTNFLSSPPEEIYNKIPFTSEKMEDVEIEMENLIPF